MGTLKVDTIEPRATSSDITLLANKFTGSAAGNLSVTGEGGVTQTNLQQGLIKAWHNFDGEGTVATRDNFNSSSLTDNGTGDYSIGITNAFANANYAAVTDNESHSGHLCMLYGEGAANGRYATDAMRFYIVENDGSGVTDSNIVTALLAGDLA